MEFRNLFNMGSFWPVPQNHIISYISFLSIEGWAPSTVNTHISALAFVHRINGWEDVTKSFLITKLKEGCNRLNPRADSRLPISPTLLEKLVKKLPSTCSSIYEVQLFKAAYLLAVFAFLRVSEFTSYKKHGDNSRVLAIDDLRVHGQKSKDLLVRIRFSKTDQKGAVSEIKVESSSHPCLCPVKAMEGFLAIRPPFAGPLFVHFSGEPMTSFQFSHMLKKGITLLGLTPSSFSSHSFRIGAATSAALGGFTEGAIKEMGRWKSSAFQVYIRPHRLICNI